MAKTLDEWSSEPCSTPPHRRAGPSPYAANARYLTSLDGFNIKRPDVPPHVFRAERDRALDPATPTGLVPLDLSVTLGLDYPATTPFILSQLRADPSRRYPVDGFQASAEIYHVIRGSGTTTGDGVSIAWQASDTFCLPGGAPTRHGRRRTPCSGSRPTSPSSGSKGSGRRPRARRRSGPRSIRWPRSAGGSSRCTWIRAGPRCRASR